MYDISAHKVYLPDGSVLEAHSPLRRARRSESTPTNVQGSTPVNVYDLEPRETPFHGVEAIRSSCGRKSRVSGRSGFLAHTYMLGPNGDSFGCVSFRNYDAFPHRPSKNRRSSTWRWWRASSRARLQRWPSRPVACWLLRCTLRGRVGSLADTVRSSAQVSALP